MKKLVVFDIAGTTLQDSNGVNDAFVAAFNHHEIFPQKSDIDSVMGLAKPTAIELVLKRNSLDSELRDPIHEKFLANMLEHYSHEENCKEIVGTSQSFAILKSLGYTIALDTGFSSDITATILQKTNWVASGLVDGHISSDEVTAGRPAPYMIFRLMERFSISSTSHVVKVGDTASDVLEGLAAGCGLTIGVTSGTYTKQQLEEVPGKFRIARDVLDATRIIKKHSK